MDRLDSAVVFVSSAVFDVCDSGESPQCLLIGLLYKKDARLDR